MKKKHRDITIDNVKYGWIVEPHPSIKIMTVLKVYKADKKVWFTITSLGTVLPSDVKKFIDFQLKKDIPVVSNTTTVKTMKAKKTVKSPTDWKVYKP